MSDPRHKGYVQKYGTDNVWELDALDPDVLEKIIEDGIRSYLDEDLRKQYLAGCDGDTRDEQNIYYQPTDFGAVIGISHVKAMAWGSDGSLAELRQEAIKSRPRPSE